jgi:hypothetical protein
MGQHMNRTSECVSADYLQPGAFFKSFQHQALGKGRSNRVVDSACVAAVASKRPSVTKSHENSMWARCTLHCVGLRHYPQLAKGRVASLLDCVQSNCQPASRHSTASSTKSRASQEDQHVDSMHASLCALVKHHPVCKGPCHFKLLDISKTTVSLPPRQQCNCHSCPVLTQCHR